mmetsp:Transcript_42524/g.85290  ORF Transcript_42524/g.85290 Transcript_42524/m.85290 type:complete len:219 (-) Transcript_42524:568-1224(-)
MRAACHLAACREAVVCRGGACQLRAACHQGAAFLRGAALPASALSSHKPSRTPPQPHVASPSSPAVARRQASPAVGPPRVQARQLLRALSRSLRASTSSSRSERCLRVLPPPKRTHFRRASSSPCLFSTAQSLTIQRGHAPMCRATRTRRRTRSLRCLLQSSTHPPLLTSSTPTPSSSSSISSRALTNSTSPLASSSGSRGGTTKSTSPGSSGTKSQK